MLRLIMRSCPTVLPTYWHSPPSFAKTFYQAFAGIVAYLQRDAAPIIWLSNSFCGYSTRGEEHQKPWHHHRLLEEMVQPYPADNTYIGVITLTCRM
jgi:hypothetical protein